ncbi:MAG: response regulator [Acidobacteria bacterium]|nr:response regulator [Acidobacteriota bacterium]
MNQEEPPTPTLKRTVSILFVEDNPADYKRCLIELQKEGLEVSADRVSTIEEFTARLRTKTYDIILADYLLNGWTGMDALTLTKEENQDIPFILLSGLLGDDRAVDCIKQGAEDYILKDRLSRLPFAIRQAMEERDLREERRQTEIALRESEAKFRALTETIASAILIYQGAECRYSNRAAELLRIAKYSDISTGFESPIKGRLANRERHYNM